MSAQTEDDWFGGEGGWEAEAGEAAASQAPAGSPRGLKIAAAVLAVTAIATIALGWRLGAIDALLGGGQVQAAPRLAPAAPRPVTVSEILARRGPAPVEQRLEEQLAGLWTLEPVAADVIVLPEVDVAEADTPTAVIAAEADAPTAVIAAEADAPTAVIAAEPAVVAPAAPAPRPARQVAAAQAPAAPATRAVAKPAPAVTPAPARAAVAERPATPEPKRGPVIAPGAPAPAAPPKPEAAAKAVAPAPEAPAKPADPGATSAKLKQAQARLGSGDAKRAIKDFEEVLRAEPGNLTARKGLAQAMSRIGRTGEAARHLEAYLARRPGDAEGLLMGAGLAEDLGNRGQARRYYEQYLQRHPTGRFAAQVQRKLQQL